MGDSPEREEKDAEMEPEEDVREEGDNDEGEPMDDAEAEKEDEGNGQGEECEKEGEKEGDKDEEMEDQEADKADEKGKDARDEEEKKGDDGEEEDEGEAKRRHYEDPALEEEEKDKAPVPKEPEEPKEQEEDAPPDSRARLAAGTVALNTAESTMNVMTSCEGKVLMTLSEGGFQHLVACGRCTTGVKAGRYLFEVKIVETRTPANSGGKYEPMPRQLLRLGFSTAESSIFLDGSEGGIFFDSEGFFAHGKSKDGIGRRWRAYQVLGVMLNLDASSPNADTVSLFVDGQRVCQPKALPEGLKGQTLYPTLNYKSMTLHVNFGSEPFAPLPFTCRMIADAAKDDTQQSAKMPPAAGTREVLFPVGLPDQGTFSWLDDFLKENPKYTELSDRAILEWAEKSGIYRTQGYGWKTSNDRPGWDFGLRELDDSSIKSLTSTIAPVLKRDYVKMEVRGNLMKSDREKALAEFEGPEFKKVALVVMGEPPATFKAKAQSHLLGLKRDLAEADAQKEFDTSRREKERAKRESKKEEKKEDGEEKKKVDGEEKKEEDDEEKKKEGGEEKKEEAAEESEAEETVDLVIAKAREAAKLTESEKEQWFVKPGKDGGDLTFKDLSASFGSFSIPTKEEGFDEIRYIWQNEEACSSFLKQWILEQKLTQRVEELEPGSWFKEQMGEWHHLMQAWRQKQSDFKDHRNRPQATQNGDRRKEEEKKEDKTEEKKEEKKEDKEEEAKEEAKEENAEGKDKKSEEKDKDMEEVADDNSEKEDKEENEEKEKKEEEEDAKEKAEEPAEIIAEDLDVWTIQDVNDVGNGEPLCANFGYEDWALLGLRFELHSLVHAFQKDINDPERTSFHENHFVFYHSKYFRKDCNPKWYGCSTSTALLDMLKDTVELNQKGILEPMLSEDTPLDNFMKLTEDERRERQRRIDSGDESAALNFMRPPPRSNDQGRGGGYKGSYNDRGGSKGKGDYGGNRGGNNDRGGSSNYDRGHSDRGGYSSRAPLSQPSYSRGGPPAPRGQAPAAPSRYSSSDGRTGGGGGGGYAAHSGGTYGGHRDSGRDRGSAPPPPPSRGGGGGYHAPAAQTSSYGGSGGGGSYGGSQKRSYAPPSSMPPAKHSRVESRGPPPSRGSYSSHGGHSSGGHRR